MKIFHTADWHLGKLIHGVYMTEDQRYVLNQFIEAVREEKPDVIIIAGDLYDRSVPPTDAVDLLDEILAKLVVELNTPVLAIAGNHDSPDRIDFGNKIMQSQGLHIVGKFTVEIKPVIVHDEYGEVHFHLIPYTDPSTVRHVFQDDTIRTHDDAMKAITSKISESMDERARHVFVGHAFVTPTGEQQLEHTSDSERPLAIGGAEYVSAGYYKPFHYTALGHLHQAHHVADEKIRYAGSPLKYSVSEEHHQKGFFAIDLDGQGNIQIEKRLLQPLRDLRRVEAHLEELERHEASEDYVFVTLLNENPVLYPMEKVRTVYPNAMHVERKANYLTLHRQESRQMERHKMDHLSLFKAFHKEMRGTDLSQEKEKLFIEVLEEVLRQEGERVETP